MEIWAIVPVKSLNQSKRRLAHLLSVDQRVNLIKRLAEQVLTALQDTPAIDQILVVSGDPDIWALASIYQINVVKEPNSQGLNIAVELGVREAFKGGAGAVLILPVDLPFVTGPVLETFLSQIQEETFDQKGGAYDNGETPLPSKMMAICPDEDEEGTNALFLKPNTDFTFHYGPGSFQRHVKEGVERGFNIKIVLIPQLQFDLDSEDDWFAYQTTAIIDC